MQHLLVRTRKPGAQYLHAGQLATLRCNLQSLHRHIPTAAAASCESPVASLQHARSINDQFEVYIPLTSLLCLRHIPWRSCTSLSTYQLSDSNATERLHCSETFIPQPGAYHLFQVATLSNVLENYRIVSAAATRNTYRGGSGQSLTRGKLVSPP